MQVGAAPRRNRRFRRFPAVEQPRIDVRVLVNRDGATGAFGAGDQAQAAALLRRIEMLFFV